MNELLMTYLQNSIYNTCSPSYRTHDGVVEEFNSFEAWSTVNPQQQVLSSVYPIAILTENISAKRKQSLSEYEDEFMQMYKSRLMRIVVSTEFTDGESNEAYELFNEMLEESRQMALLTLQVLYWEKAKIKDIKTLTKLLNLLASCPFDVAGEVGLCLFATALINKDIRVKSMALRVAGHWACPHLLPYIETIDLADYPWLEMKVDNIKRSILRK